MKPALKILLFLFVFLSFYQSEGVSQTAKQEARSVIRRPVSVCKNTNTYLNGRNFVAFEISAALYLIVGNEKTKNIVEIIEKAVKNNDYIRVTFRDRTDVDFTTPEIIKVDTLSRAENIRLKEEAAKRIRNLRNK